MLTRVFLVGVFERLAHAVGVLLGVRRLVFNDCSTLLKLIFTGWSNLNTFRLTVFVFLRYNTTRCLAWTLRTTFIFLNLNSCLSYSLLSLKFLNLLCRWFHLLNHRCIFILKIFLSFIFMVDLRLRKKLLHLLIFKFISVLYYIIKVKTEIQEDSKLNLTQ